MKLTKIACDRAKYDGKTLSVRWDGELRGFGLRCFPSGTKSFILKYRTSTGRQGVMTIGGYPPMTVEQARDRARKAMVAVRDGKNPMEERRAARAKGKTVAALCDEYIEKHAKKSKRTWKGDEYRIKKHLKPEWGTLPFLSVRRDDVKRLHRKIGEAGAPYEANRVLALVSAIWTQAKEWGYLDEDAPNPASKIKRFDEKERDVWVQPDQMPKLIEAVLSEPNVYIRRFVVLALLTGCRRSELLGAKWEDVIDYSGRLMLKLPETKNGKPHYVPLSAEARAVLESIPREEENPFIFPGHKKGSHLVNVDKNWRAIRERSGMAGLRVHDLRRTVGSMLAMSNVSETKIGKILNNPTATGVYARLAEEAGRKPLEAHGGQMAELVGEHAEALGLVAKTTRKTKGKARA